MNPLLSLAPVGTRRRFLHLLLLADESELQVLSYMDRGDLYVFSSSKDETQGITLAIPLEPGVVELRAVAVEQEKQGQGIGKCMLAAVLSELHDRGFERVVVGTANAAIGQLAFYQKLGFRMLRIERDFFSPVRGYAPVIVEAGIRMRDMVWLDLLFGDLTGQ